MKQLIAVGAVMVRFRAVLLWACALGFVLLRDTGVGADGQHHRAGSRSGRRRDSKCNGNGDFRATGTSQTVTTTSSGLYNFAALPPAVYTVSATATGFATATRDNVTLNIAATLPLNFNLAVGGASTTVEVAGVTAAPVETDSFQLSTVIDAKQIMTSTGAAGSVSAGAAFARCGHGDQQHGGFSVNGQRDRNNNFMLDGADNNDTSVPASGGWSRRILTPRRSFA